MAFAILPLPASGTVVIHKAAKNLPAPTGAESSLLPRIERAYVLSVGTHLE
jgi:hypothetical protein